jgi:hypothetical protein
MNKEQQEILDEVYENYVSTHENFEWTDDFCKKNLKDYGDQWGVFSKEEFINKCKTDTEFSEKWGLKIEERELSLEERIEITDNISKNIREDLYSFAFNNPLYVGDSGRSDDEQRHLILDDYDIPTKLITITYNNKTIESYE